MPIIDGVRCLFRIEELEIVLLLFAAAGNTADQASRSNNNVQSTLQQGTLRGDVSGVE